MSAPTRTRSLPPARRAGAATAASTRLHWWAPALPALAFSLLLLLLAGSGEAHAATGEVSGLVQVAQQLLRAVG
ncbi:hypothetical protein [Streptomyces sp. TN58]|uniref:hypothetical protein n=1 Tax=Streptomyces sp. TN58 TaxID=234612 RepID=UPI0004AAE081|nr:hypothetical protein [Streptomyces sp. TN58]APU39702.1 hypothetical protein BSL84_07865 [Streptomyces sp. TN58]